MVRSKKMSSGRRIGELCESSGDSILDDVNGLVQ